MTRYTQADLEGFAARGMLQQCEVLGSFVGVDVALRSPGPRSARRNPEQELQRAVCEFWELQYPSSWPYTFHVPNELRSKNRTLAGIFSALGVKPGIPDLLCLQHRGPYTGAALELKSGHGRVSAAQDDWAMRLKDQGYLAGVAFSFDQARDFLRDFHGHAARVVLP